MSVPDVRYAADAPPSSWLRRAAWGTFVEIAAFISNLLVADFLFSAWFWFASAEERNEAGFILAQAMISILVFPLIFMIIYVAMRLLWRRRLQSVNWFWIPGVALGSVLALAASYTPAAFGVVVPLLHFLGLR